MRAAGERLAGPDWMVRHYFCCMRRRSSRERRETGQGGRIFSWRFMVCKNLYKVMVNGGRNEGAWCRAMEVSPQEIVL